MTRPHQDAIRDVLGPVDGAQIPGGCEFCEAYQTAEPAAAGVWVLTVHHDDGCPVLNGNDDQASRGT